MGLVEEIVREYDYKETGLVGLISTGDVES